MLINLTSRRATATHDLVDLLDECHQRIRHFVSVACEVARRSDVPTDQVTEVCADVARYFREALPLHVADEEESLGPRLRGLSPDTDRALDVMVAQHGQHTLKLELLLRALDEVRLGPVSEGAKEKLAAAAEPVRVELEEHLALEESVIFPIIRKMVPLETQALILDELRQRRRAPGGHPRAL